MSCVDCVEMVTGSGWIFNAWCSHCENGEVLPPGRFVEVHACLASESDVLIGMEISHALKGCNGRLSWGDKP